MSKMYQTNFGKIYYKTNKKSIQVLDSNQKTLGNIECDNVKKVDKTISKIFRIVKSPSELNKTGLIYNCFVDTSLASLLNKINSFYKKEDRITLDELFNSEWLNQIGDNYIYSYEKDTF